MTRLPRADWGKATAHTGLGVTVFAVAAMNAWAIEDIRVVQAGEAFPLGNYEVTLVEVHEEQGPNYTSMMAEMNVTRDGKQRGDPLPRKARLSGAGHAHHRSRD